MTFMKPFRVGYGYDTHRLVTDRTLILGGVDIPFDKGLKGHSDADVLLHAICDAMLGALNLRDIGYHFPNTDPQYKDADSTIFLLGAHQLVTDKGYMLGNIDCTLVAERPKLNPHVPQMQQRIAQLLSIPEADISIKATTNERMDDVGQELGIIAYAVVSVYSKQFYDLLNQQKLS